MSMFGNNLFASTRRKVLQKCGFVPDVSLFHDPKDQRFPRWRYTMSEPPELEDRMIRDHNAGVLSADTCHTCPAPGLQGMSRGPGLQLWNQGNYREDNRKWGGEWDRFCNIEKWPSEDKQSQIHFQFSAALGQSLSSGHRAHIQRAKTIWLTFPLVKVMAWISP